MKEIKIPPIARWEKEIAVSYTHLDVYKRQVKYKETKKLLQRIF